MGAMLSSVALSQLCRGDMTSETLYACCGHSLFPMMFTTSKSVLTRMIIAVDLTQTQSLYSTAWAHALFDVHLLSSLHLG